MRKHLLNYKRKVISHLFPKRIVQRAHLGIVVADEFSSVWADLSHQTLQPNQSYMLWFRFGSDLSDILY